MKKFAAVLLAGGRSSRMRTNKAFIKYQGIPMWRFQIDKLVKLDPEQLFLSVQQGAEFPSGPWSFVHDRSAELGPLGGLEAALRKTHSDLLVTLAVDMPRMTGFELVSQIKNDSHLRALPVMIVSYKGSEEDRNRGLEAGANYYLTKSSFHDETLLQAVVDLIGEA